MRTRTWLGIGVSLALVATVYAHLPACGCTLRGLLSGRLSGELDRIADSQKVFFKHHSRYARTTAELGYPLDTLFRVDFLTPTDSGVTLRGTSVRMPELSCVLQVSRRKWFREEPTCTYEDP